MEINAIIIKSEPEIIQLFPYLLAFLEENLKNKEIMKMPKIQYIILYHIKAIAVNKYFNLITYINNILEILMSLLLYSNNIDDNDIKNIIKVKEEIIIFLEDLMKNKFNKYIPDLIYSISNFILPINNTNSILFKSLCAIKCINSFGYEYSINYIYPQITRLLIYLKNPICFKYKEKIIFVEKNNYLQQNQNNNQNSSQSNQNSINNQSSIPIKTFTIPFSNDFAMPLSLSNIAEESLVQSFGQNNNISEKMYFRVSDNYEDENLCKENLYSFLYIEIYRSIEIALNGMIKLGVSEEQFEQSKNELNQIFGENLTKLFFNNINNI